MNWIARLKSDKNVIGHFQAGFGKSLESNLAYTVGINFQKKGYAFEGPSSVIGFLFRKMNIRIVKMWIDTRNMPSIKLVKKLGLSQIEFIAKADHFKGTDSDEFVFELQKQAVDL